MPAVPTIKGELSAREHKFVEHFVCGDRKTLDRAQASAVAAGYSPSYAEGHAHLWVHDKPSNPKPHVYKAIIRRREEVRSIVAMDRNEVMAELGKLARFNSSALIKSDEDGRPYVDISDLTHQEFAALAEVTVDEYTEGRGEDSVAVKRIKVKTADKLRALDIISKALGMQRVVHSNDPDNPMPGVTSGVRYDISVLTEAEATQLRDLLAKCVVV